MPTSSAILNVQLILAAILLGRVLSRLRFLPILKNGSKNLYQIFRVQLSIRNITCSAIRQKRPDLWNNESWILNDNAPVHISLLVRELLAKNNTIMLPQPPYSPDLTACDFFLFTRLKRQKSKTSQNTSKQKMSKINRTFKIAELVGISGYMSTKITPPKNRNSKFAIIFEQTT